MKYICKDLVKTINSCSNGCEGVQKTTEREDL